MRLPLILTIATLAVSGCVVQNPGMAPPPAPLPSTRKRRSHTPSSQSEPICATIGMRTSVAFAGTCTGG